MLCENAYYPNGDEKEKPNCRKMKENEYFKGKCPLIYYCTINERYEQTSDMFNCKYRKEGR